MQVDSQSPTFHLSRFSLTNRRPTHEALAIALDLGTIQSTSEPIVWAVGVVRDPVIQYTNASGQREERSAYYWANYTTIHDAVTNRFTFLVVYMLISRTDPGCTQQFRKCLRKRHYP